MRSWKLLPRSPLFLGSLLAFLGAFGLPSATVADVADAFADPILLGDLEPGTGASGPFGYVSLGDRALFLTIEERAPAGSSSQTRLWGTDGTAAGTRVLPPDADVPFPIQAVSPDGLAFYNAIDREGAEPAGSFWVTDGTVAGTVELADGVTLFGFPFFAPDGRLYFAGQDGQGEIADVEPWVSDGTPEGTFRLLDTIPGPDPNSVHGFAAFGERVYFLGIDPDSGRLVVWKTDGTPAGTGVAVAPEDDFQLFSDLVVAGSSLYLTGLDDLGFVAVWRSDGTLAGTVKLARIGRSDGESGPLGADFLADLSDASGDRTVWRVLEIGSRAVLWLLDGTPEGAERIGELSPNPTGDVLVLGGVAYFRAHTEETGTELFRTDGTEAGTGPVVDWCAGPCSGIDDGPVLFAGRMLLRSRQETETGSEPLVSDGTAEGTRLIADLCTGPCGSGAGIRFGTDFGRLFVFVGAGAGTARQVWATDLTAEGTVRLTFFPGGVASHDVRRAGDRLVFSASDPATGVEPWVLPFDTAAIDALPPPGPWHTGPGLPGFEVKARITAGNRVIETEVEPDCLTETLCLSGALPGRSEVFVRVPGPKPNGFLWPTLVKLTTSEVEVWIRQVSTGETRFYRLEGARPGFDELPGLFDRNGFRP